MVLLGSHVARVQHGARILACGLRPKPQHDTRVPACDLVPEHRWCPTPWLGLPGSNVVHVQRGVMDVIPGSTTYPNPLRTWYLNPLRAWCPDPMVMWCPNLRHWSLAHWTVSTTQQTIGD